ncbi:MAG: hypothetical protein ACYDA8_03655 [Deferrisomatales bacterium]
MQDDLKAVVLLRQLVLWTVHAAIFIHDDPAPVEHDDLLPQIEHAEHWTPARLLKPQEFWSSALATVNGKRPQTVTTINGGGSRRAV